jgi:hypothetical protein
MEMPDDFNETPWGAEPTDDWNRPAYWYDYYRQLLAKAPASAAEDSSLDLRRECREQV